MNQTYYLPIKSANLAHYYVQGCICPTKYLDNRNKDIQNIFDNYILLSDTKFTNETNCSLEIVLNEKMETVKNISKNFFLLKTPLSISRIKNIFFQNEKQKKITVFNVTNGAAFLPPDNFIKIDSITEKVDTLQLQDISIKANESDWSDKLDKFNRVMGGIALMNIAGNKHSEYPLNYFSVISSINFLIKDQITNQSIPVTNSHEWIVTNNGLFNKFIYSKVNNVAVEQQALKDKIKLQKSNGKYIIENIKNESITYVLAILASYGEGTRMKIDTFISDFLSNKFPEKKKEGLALTFGINKGYDAFRNKYKTQNFEANIKFKLNSQLDYYIIESIYQFVFNDKKNNREFEYIDGWCPRLHENVEGYDSYEILDKKIAYKKNKTIKEYEAEIKELKNTIKYQERKIRELENDLKKKDTVLVPKDKKYQNGVLFSESHHDRSIRNKAELSKLTVKQLRVIAKEKGIKYLNSKKKKVLIDEILKHK